MGGAAGDSDEGGIPGHTRLCRLVTHDDPSSDRGHELGGLEAGIRQAVGYRGLRSRDFGSWWPVDSLQDGATSACLLGVCLHCIVSSSDHRPSARDLTGESCLAGLDRYRTRTRGRRSLVYGETRRQLRHRIWLDIESDLDLAGVGRSRIRYFPWQQIDEGREHLFLHDVNRYLAFAGRNLYDGLFERDLLGFQWSLRSGANTFAERDWRAALGLFLSLRKGNYRFTTDQCWSTCTHHGHRSPYCCARDVAAILFILG